MEGGGGVGGWEMVKRKRLEEEGEAWPPTGADRFRHVHGVVIYGVGTGRGGEDSASKSYPLATFAT